MSIPYLAFSQIYNEAHKHIHLKHLKNLKNFGPKGTTCKLGAKEDVAAEEICTLRKTKCFVQE